VKKGGLNEREREREMGREEGGRRVASARVKMRLVSLTTVAS